MSKIRETYDTDQPWVCYTYGLTHDRWWPFWNSTRILGFARIKCDCCVCGKIEILRVPIPRWGVVPEPASGKHPMRERFLTEHAHPDRGHPMSWVRPLRSIAAHTRGLDLDLLGMRLESDLNNDDTDPTP